MCNSKVNEEKWAIHSRGNRNVQPYMQVKVGKEVYKIGSGARGQLE